MAFALRRYLEEEAVHTYTTALRVNRRGSMVQRMPATGTLGATPAAAS